ncbi:MAG TPA: IclR family transcriptional regulator [Dongiaceae bacterium]|nr:IclR family transcriptional regulator [Dongiaceae bacterium]
MAQAQKAPPKAAQTGRRAVPAKKAVKLVKPAESQSISAGDAGGRTRGIDRAFEILECLHDSKKPLRPNEIAVAIGAPKSTTYDVVGLMLGRGILDRADAEGRVYLGRRLYLFGLSHLTHFDVMRLASGFLDHLSEVTGQTAQLCVLDNRKYVVAQMKEGERHFRISSDVGEPVPLPWTASGRVLVSHLDDKAILKLIPAADFILPDGKRLGEKTFLREVAEARREGFYSCDGTAGRFTHCFAAAVYDEQRLCIATLCLLTPREEGLQDHARYKQALVDAARQMTARIGGERPLTQRAG